MKQDEADDKLIEIMEKSWDDPLYFIMTAFPWGEKGTALENEEGPEEWQVEVCKRITRHIRSGTKEGFRMAVASGHGIGKSCMSAWIIHWFQVTRKGGFGRVTANTDAQVKGVTWRELAKWVNLSLFKDWFELSATQCVGKIDPQNWKTSIANWSETNTEAFAGGHGQALMYMYDEASAIIDGVWATSEGAMTEPGAFWFVWGNPTRNTGKFRECFNAGSSWSTMQVDARAVRRARDPGYAERIRKEYGEDQYKIRVLGQFPDTDMSQFIPGHAVRLAYERGLFTWGDERNLNIPLVIAVDVARFGDDETVIFGRRGNHLAFIDRRRELDIFQTSTIVQDYIRRLKPRAVNIDVVGYGAGVVDFLRNTGHRAVVYGVNGGTKASHPDRYYNVRAETWAGARDWITNSGVLSEENPDHRELIKQGISVLFGYNDKGQLRLERKEELRKRLGFSPDIFDALALTFARRLPAFLDGEHYAGSSNPNSVEY